MNPQGLYMWSEYWGMLLDDRDPHFASRVYGYENISQSNKNKYQAEIPDDGTCFGFVQSGEVECAADGRVWKVSAQQWFSQPSAVNMRFSPGVRMVVLQLKDYRGVTSMGGPIESKGRLRYIDGCSDTLLCAPPVKGDPCLNQLHFPQNINQTEHHHPSARAGIVASGSGQCRIPGQVRELAEGLIFYIGKGQSHSFRTESGQNMNIIAYHPDSDWGPTHEEHPMINRTWVDGRKIDNSSSDHLHNDIILG